MSKGAVLDEAFIDMIGFPEHLLTLTASMENKHHEILQESMFHISTKEEVEPIFLERKYVFDNQVSIRSSYGKGDKILVWLQRVVRTDPNDGSSQLNLLLVRDMFLLGDWREFQRFKLFVKSMRILDAQARSYLAEHHQDFPSWVGNTDGIKRILDCLGKIAEWPDLDGHASKASSLESVAKAYSKNLAAIRSSSLLPSLLLKRPSDVRFNIFRLLSFVESLTNNSSSLIKFVCELGQSTNEDAVVQVTSVIKNGRDLQRAFAAIRKYLLSTKGCAPV